MMEEIGELARGAKSYGHAVVVRPWPPEGSLSKVGETAVDMWALCRAQAALLGAHIIKRKPPSDVVELEAAKKSCEKIDVSTPARLISMSCSALSSAGVSWFSPPAKQRTWTVSVLGSCHPRWRDAIERSTWQRPRDEPLKMLDSVIAIHPNEAPRFAEKDLGVPGESKAWLEPSAPSRAPRRHGNADMVC